MKRIYSAYQTHGQRGDHYAVYGLEAEANAHGEHCYDHQHGVDGYI